jgi:hypothetical protein
MLNNLVKCNCNLENFSPFSNIVEVGDLEKWQVDNNEWEEVVVKRNVEPFQDAVDHVQ